MKYCSSCGRELVDTAAVCPYCGTACGVASRVDPNDAPSTAMALLGFFIPIAGLILYLINMETKPQMAKSAGKGALISVIVSTAMGVIYMILYFIFIFVMIGGMGL